MHPHGDLQGLTVLNTRPLLQGIPLTRAILARGGQVITLPALEIVETSKAWLKGLDIHQFSQVIFTSANAVDFFCKEFKTLPENLKITAIGEGSAKALHKAGNKVHFLPETPSSESLLDLKNFSHVSNQALLLVKGEGGLSVIEETLKARGAKLSIVEVYKRQLPAMESDRGNWQEKKIDIIIVTSRDAMENLFKLLDKRFHAWLRQRPWLLISQRLADFANQSGISTIILSRPEDILETLCQFKKDC